jgi:hypothetical protein
MDGPLRPHLRSGSHLGQVPARTDRGLVAECIQNVIQAIPRNLHFLEDLACVTARLIGVASAAELQCSKSGFTEGVGAKRNQEK